MNRVGFRKISLVLVCLIFASVFAFAAHNSTVDLTPEWSPAEQHVDYTAKFCKVSGDTVNEVRIYKDYDGSIYYTDFECADKPGWEKLYISTYPACFYVANPASPDYNPLNADGECAEFHFSAHTPPRGLQYCNLSWKFETRDTSDYWVYRYDTTSVDDLEPVIVKTLGDPKIVDGTTWITQDTPISIEAYDVGDCAISGIKYCEYRYDVDGTEVKPWTTITWDSTGQDINGVMHHYYTFKYKEDSLHHLQVRCYDIAGNLATHEQTEKVDSTPPTTVKTYGTPLYPTPYAEFVYPHWITSATQVTLAATDGGAICAIGGVKTYYRDFVLPAEKETACRDYTYCNPEYYGNPELKFTEYTGPFTKPEESCHVIEYYSVDAIGNKETTKSQCVFVDNTKPLLTKDVGTSKVEGDHTTFDWWVTKNTPIDLYCTDQQPHPVNHVNLWYRIWDDVSGNWTAWIDGIAAEAHKTIYFTEDSVHKLQYYCEDILGNTEGTREAPHEQTYKVDTVPPSITKTMVGNYRGTCPPQGETDKCYVADNSTSGVHVAVADGGAVCAVDNVTCNYEVWWEGRKIDSGQFNGSGTDIIFHEDSTHTLKINCQDALGNTMAEDVEEFLVDSTPPETVKTYGTPFYPLPYVESVYPHWITSQTPITLAATDAKVGVNQTFYKVSLVDDISCSGTQYCTRELDGSGTWNTYTAPFTIPDQSCHMIEYYSNDLLGNTEQVNWQCVYVDNTAPTATKDVGTPKVACDPLDPLGCDYYITKQTPITLTCTDGKPHPVDNVSFKYRYRTSTDCINWGDWNGWFTGNSKFTFPEDSCHQLEYYCEDALGNHTQTYAEIDVVDTVGPTIQKTIVGPKSGDCLPEEEGDICYLDGVTTIEVTATDPQPHPVDTVNCEWSYTLDDSATVYGPYTTAPIHFPEETKHNLTVKCWDALGNTTYDYETFYVDKTPPTTTKSYGEPTFVDEVSQTRWISSQTLITLAVEDTGTKPCKSGVKETKYRVTRVADSYCDKTTQDYCNTEGTGTWNVYAEPFTINEDSCHIIEYYSVDNVDKTETTKKQCVYVDNQPPTPTKIVDEPKTLWDGKNSIFYPEETAHCWDETKNQIECWKVTTATYISMDCTDPQPHPVDNEEVCFKVDFDGEDKTEMYCNGTDDPFGNPGYGGSMNEGGWCCVDHTITQFQFWEESEHNLQYYCTDALGNEGPIDDEKFKVEGTKFEIPLYKKWNLISVPFVLLKDDTEEVFAGVESDLKAVWTYKEDGQWYVYRPESPATSNLVSVDPGYGYWVLMADENLLTIGGSLIGTGAPVVPPSRQIKAGWNLIGYYGTSWSLYKYIGLMDDFETKCGQYAPESPPYWVYGDKAFCSLSSLVDTQQGYPKWDSLWSYLNCGDPAEHTYWLGLNACPEDGMNRMYAGRGYWMHIDQPEEYAPSTVCVWNDDQICYATGGGILP